ncbi:MAG: hypothetical protein LBT33_06720 [Spirochaetia bacterium]|jgi:hypothetical protein|nr:hypothetical protein [Spirochaetia bacterium]
MKKTKRLPAIELKKILLSGVLAAAAIISFCAAPAARGASAEEGNGPLQEKLTEKFVQVGKVWAATKVVSGVVSVLATIQIEITPFGFGTSVSPLGWTTAVDNVLDQLSLACLWAMGAITVEKILLALSLWAALKIIVPLCALLCLLGLWWPGAFRYKIKKALPRFAITAFAACFAIPLSLGLSALVEESLLSNEVEKKLEAINAGSGEAGSMVQEKTDATGFSVIETIKGISSSIARFVSEGKSVFDAYIQDALNYLMYFAVANILLPILTIFGLWRLSRHVLALAGRRPAKHGAIKP